MDFELAPQIVVVIFIICSWRLNFFALMLIFLILNGFVVNMFSYRLVSKELKIFGKISVVLGSLALLIWILSQNISAIPEPTSTGIYAVVPLNINLS